MGLNRCFSYAMLGLLLLANSVLAQGRHPVGPPPVVEDLSYDPPPAPEGILEGCSSCQGNDCACSGCGGGCGQGCCDVGCGGGCCGFGRLSAGYAFVLVQPHFENDVAFVTRSVANNVVREQNVPFDFEVETSPRVWLEYRCCDTLGVRTSYWQFDHGAEAFGFRDGVDILPPIDRNFNIAADVAGDVFHATAGLDMDVLDFEGTKWTSFCSWQFGTSAGLRYATTRQIYRAEVIDAADTLVHAVITGHRFDGVGPTFSVEVRRPFGCLACFSMARASLLFGEGKSEFASFQDITAGGIAQTTLTSSRRDDVLPVGEIQVGVEWHHQWCNGRKLSFRTAMEGQLWQGAGNSVDENGNLGFFGLHVAVGISL